MTDVENEISEFIEIPDSQQEDEDDLNEKISFKESIVMTADWTIETIDNQIKKGNIDLQPDFQRRGAWGDERQSRLIESIIVGMPVPNIVLADNKNSRGKFIVIDGKQRLLSINRFLANEYKLKGLDIRPDLNGLLYSELPSDDRENFDNSTLRSSVIKGWKDESFLYAIFYRLNSGSLPLSPQELRKALIGGKLLITIEEYLKASVDFHRLFGNVLDKRMRDSELVLRFIAYDQSLDKYDGNFKRFLDSVVSYHENEWDHSQQDVTESLKRLDLALRTTAEIFGRNSFKKWLGDKYERVINRAVFDAVTRFFSEVDISDAALAKKEEVIQAFNDLCMVQEFRNAVEKTTKTVDATTSRINMWGERLATILNKNYDLTTHRIL